MRKLFKRFAIFALSVCMLAVTAVGLAACGEKDPPIDQDPPASVDVAGVTLNKSELSLTRSAAEKLVATLVPAGAKGTVIWTSDNPEIATVTTDGTVTAVDMGTATITATVDDLYTATCNVTVIAPESVITFTNEKEGSQIVFYADHKFTLQTMGSTLTLGWEIDEDTGLIEAIHDYGEYLTCNTYVQGGKINFSIYNSYMSAPLVHSVSIKEYKTIFNQAPEAVATVQGKTDGNEFTIYDTREYEMKIGNTTTKGDIEIDKVVTDLSNGAGFVFQTVYTLTLKPYTATSADEYITATDTVKNSKFDSHHSQSENNYSFVFGGENGTEFSILRMRMNYWLGNSAGGFIGEGAAEGVDIFFNEDNSFDFMVNVDYDAADGTSTSFHGWYHVTGTYEYDAAELYAPSLTLDAGTESLSCVYMAFLDSFIVNYENEAYGMTQSSSTNKATTLNATSVYNALKDYQVAPQTRMLTATATTIDGLEANKFTIEVSKASAVLKYNGETLDVFSFAAIQNGDTVTFMCSQANYVGIVNSAGQNQKGFCTISFKENTDITIMVFGYGGLAETDFGTVTFAMPAGEEWVEFAAIIGLS